MNDQKYIEVRTIDHVTITQTASGHDTVALSSDDDEILLVNREDETRIPGGDSLVDLALNSNLYIATRNGVRALTFEGSTIWETPLDGVVGIDTMPGENLVITCTETELVGFNEVTGTEQFRTSLLHPDVATDQTLISDDHLAVLSAWWFLTVIDENGDPLVDTQVDGAIESVGMTEDIAVARLQDGRLVGVELESGEIHWERELNADWLAPRGRDGLLTSIGGQFSTVTSDGQLSQVGTLNHGSPAVGASGDPLIIASDTSLTVYRPSTAVAPLAGRLISDTVLPGDALEIEIDSRFDQMIKAKIEIRSSDLPLENDSVTVELPPGDTEVISVRVPEEGNRVTKPTATISATCLDIQIPPQTGSYDLEDGEFEVSIDKHLPTELFVESIPIEGGAGSVNRTVDTDLSVDAIRGSDLVLTLSIQNDSDYTLTNLAIEYDSGDMSKLPPGQTTTKSVVVPLGTESITVSGSSVDTTVKLPDFPSPPLDISVEPSPDGFVDIVFENRTDVPITDEVRVSGEVSIDDIHRSAQIASSSIFLLALPVGRATDTDTIVVSTSTGTISSTVDILESQDALSAGERSEDEMAGQPEPDDGTGLDSERSQVRNQLPEDNDDLVSPADDVTGKHPKVDSPTADRKVPDQEEESSLPRHKQPTESSEEADQRSHSDVHANRHGTGGDPHDEPSNNPPHSFDSSRETSDSELSKSGQNNERSENGPSREYESEDALPFRLYRSLDEDTLTRGNALREKITLSSQLPNESVVLIESDTHELEVRLPANGKVRMQRYHATYEQPGASQSLPELSASSEDQTLDLEPKSLTIRDSPIIPWVSLSPQTSGSLAEIGIANGLEYSVEVTGINFPPISTRAPVNSFTVDSGDRGVTEVDIPDLSANKPQLTGLEVATPNSTEKLWTVATIRSPLGRTLDLEIESLELLQEGEFNVTLGVVNVGEETLRLEIEARGEAPDEYLYSKAELAEFHPGETFSHRIECTVENPTVRIPLHLSAHGIGPEDLADSVGQKFEETLIITGDLGMPVDKWAVEGEDRKSEPRIDLVSTPVLIGTN